MTNIDQAELARFEGVAHRWWDSSGDFRPLHDINPARTAFVAERIALRGARIADLGCGGGLLTEAMAGQGADVLGVDAGETAIQVARLHALESGSTARYRQCTFESLLPELAGTFDAVTCMELLEHVPDPAATIVTCAALLRPGGKLIASTINRSPRSYALAVIAAEYVLQLVPRGTHDYQKFIRPHELAAMVRRAGLDVGEVVGMSYSPFTHHCTIGGPPAVNYFLCADKVAT